MSDLWLSLGKKCLCVILLLVLSGCSTLGGWFGGDEGEEMANTPGTETPNEPAGPTAEEQLAEKDQALIEQGMRIAAAERQLQAMQEENSALKQELDTARQEAEETQALLEQANESQIAAASQNAASNMASMPRPMAPDGGYGLHLASYELRESIEPGIAALTRQIPVLMEGRPIKLAPATVRGRNFNRLIVGQFDTQADAIAECGQALLLVSYCEVVAFEGEDF